jgi:hypothetical protein
MPITLNPACPLCGLRFGNQPHLDLHIREDHRQPVSGERSGDGDPGSTREPGSGADSPPDPQDPAATPSETSKKATAASRHEYAGISRVLRIFRFSGGEAIDNRQVKDATEIPEEMLSPDPGSERETLARDQAAKTSPT